MKTETTNLRYDHAVRAGRADFSQIFKVGISGRTVCRAFRARGYVKSDGENDWWLEIWSPSASEWNMFARRENVEGVLNIASFKVAGDRAAGYSRAKTNFKKFAEYAESFVSGLDQ